MKAANKDFMLLCGFEKFDDIYVRIDMLERLFLLIFNSEKDEKEVKVKPEMLNLLGCSRENFNKLLKKWIIKFTRRRKIFSLNIFHQKRRFSKI